MTKILVIAKKKRYNKMICALLNDNGFYTDSCFYADRAYEFLKNNAYSLIIYDIFLPSIDGMDFIEHIKNINKNIPVLFISSLEDINSREIKCSLYDYILTPAKPKELICKITKMLKNI